MSDDSVANPGVGGDTFRTRDIGGVKWPYGLQAWYAGGVAHEVADVNGERLPVKAEPWTGTVFMGQQAVTTAAAALPAAPCRGVTVKALIGNAIPIYVGLSGVSISTGYELQPGESHHFHVTNLNLLAVIAASTGAAVCWAGVS